MARYLETRAVAYLYCLQDEEGEQTVWWGLELERSGHRQGLSS